MKKLLCLALGLVCLFLAGSVPPRVVRGSMNRYYATTGAMMLYVPEERDNYGLVIDGDTDVWFLQEDGTRQGGWDRMSRIHGQLEVTLGEQTESIDSVMDLQVDVWYEAEKILVLPPEKIIIWELD